MNLERERSEGKGLDKRRIYRSGIHSVPRVVDALVEEALVRLQLLMYSHHVFLYMRTVVRAVLDRLLF